MCRTKFRVPIKRRLKLYLMISSIIETSLSHLSQFVVHRCSAIGVLLAQRHCRVIVGHVFVDICGPGSTERALRALVWALVAVHVVDEHIGKLDPIGSGDNQVALLTFRHDLTAAIPLPDQLLCNVSDPSHVPQLTKGRVGRADT